MFKSFQLVAVMLTLSLIMGCVPEGLMRTWKSDMPVPNKFRNLMVMGLVNNVTIRNQVEIEVVQAASKIGLSSTNGMSMFPPELGKPFDDIERVKARLRYHQFDAILTVTVIDYQAERYIPPDVAYQPLVFYDRFRNYYYRTYDLVYIDGYIQRDTRYFLETNLYELQGGNLMWSGRSKTFTRFELEDYLITYSRGLFKELKLDGLI